MSELLVKNPGLVLAAQGDEAIFIVAGRPPVVWRSAIAARVAAVVRATIDPRPRAELAAALPADVLADLVAREILIAPAPPVAVAPPPPLVDNLVVGVTGAVGAVDLIPILHHWSVYLCRRLDIVMTASATRFVAPDVLRSMGHEVWTDAHETRGDVHVPHIQLARRADLVVVMPASAHTIHKLATGACDDLLSLVVAATTAPVAVVPAMNRAMWEHFAIADNLERLRTHGVFVVEPTVGVEVANGRSRALEFGSMPPDPALLTATMAAVVKLRGAVAVKAVS